MKVPTYLDMNRKRAIGIRAIPKIIEIEGKIIEDIPPKYEPIIADRGVKLFPVDKHIPFIEIELNINTPEEETHRIAAEISKKYTIESYYIEYRDFPDHVDVNCMTFIPNGRNKRVFIGVWDKKSDVYFPKTGVYSKNFKSPVFGPITLPLPTTIEKFKKEIKNKSITLFDSETPPQWAFMELLRRILHAAIVYKQYPVFIADPDELDEFKDMISRIEVGEGEFNAFNYKISDDEYRRENDPQNKRGENIYISMPDVGDEEIERFRKKYPNLTEYAIKDLFAFLAESYYVKHTAKTVGDIKKSATDVFVFYKMLDNIVDIGKVTLMVGGKSVILKYDL